MAGYSSTLAWKIPERRSLVGYSPRGCKELDTAEQLHFHFLNLCLLWVLAGNFVFLCFVLL